MRMVMASTSILSQVTSGNSAATSTAISSRIGLGHHRQQLAWARTGKREGKAHDAGNARAREDADIGGCLLWQSAVYAPADTGVLSLRILAHDHPVKLGAPDGPERTGNAGKDARWTHVGILVKWLADGELQAPQGEVIGNVGGAG
jgi:hypothetical protein